MKTKHQKLWLISYLRYSVWSAVKWAETSWSDFHWNSDISFPFMKGNATRNQRMKWKGKERKYKEVKWNWKKNENSLEKLNFWNGMELSIVKLTKTSWSDTHWNCKISFPFVKWRNFIVAGYWDCSHYTFGIWASHSDGDHSSSDKLPLGFGLGFRELQRHTAPGKRAGKGMPRQSWQGTSFAAPTSFWSGPPMVIRNSAPATRCH